MALDRRLGRFALEEVSFQSSTSPALRDLEIWATSGQVRHVPNPYR